MAIFRQLVEAIQRLATRPDQELSRAQRFVRFTIDLTRHCFQELKFDQATQMAAALTYRTIFSLIPIVLLSLVVFQTSDMFKDKRKDVLHSVLEWFGVDAIEVTTMSFHAGPPGSKPAASRPEASEPASQEVAREAHERTLRLDEILDHMTSRFSNREVGSISVVGLAVLIWAALALVITVEQTFNRIYDCPTGRSWLLRVPVYWAVITLGPVLLAVSIYVAGLISSATKANFGSLGFALDQLGHCTALASSWLLLFLMYRLLPNTKVRTRPAAIGSLVAALLWEAGKWGFKLYVVRAVSISQIYGALGLIPLFLLWVYLTWLVVLFGLELTYTLQAMKGQTFKHDAHGGGRQVVVESAWVLPVMSEVARAFTEGKTINAAELSRRLHLPLRATGHVARKLEEAGLLLRVQAGRTSDAEAGYTLGRPPEKVKVAELLDVARLLAGGEPEAGDHPGWAYLAKLAGAQRQAAGDETLRNMMGP